jgi:ribonuclease R
VGSGVFVQLASPFVDVLVRLEDLGGDRWEVDDEALRVVAARSGQVIALGDAMLLEIADVGMLRRTVYGRRIGGEARPGEAGRPDRPPQRRKGEPKRTFGKGGGSPSGPAARGGASAKQGRGGKGAKKKNGGSSGPQRKKKTRKR